MTKRENKNYNLQEHDFVVFIRLKSQRINVLNNIDYEPYTTGDCLFLVFESLFAQL